MQRVAPCGDAGRIGKLRANAGNPPGDGGRFGTSGMITGVFDIDPIRFNGVLFARVELTESACKHFVGQSVEYYRYIASTLDGQARPADETDDDACEIYRVASAT